MIVARFTAATGWAGKQIGYDNGQFSLEGHGPVTAQDVLNYDAQGQLAWEYDGLREWVGQVAGVPGAAPAQYAPGAAPTQYAAATLPAQYAPVAQAPSPPWMAVVGFVLAIAGFLFPVGLVWWIGLAFSWMGYNEAKREQLPSGLALAGLIINAVMTVVSVIAIILIIALLVPLRH
jgi:hypothetical protein